jgi:hypothetical protein
MSVHVLITGALFRAPEQRISKTGKPFWSATLKVRDGDATAWWKLLVFSESAGAELMRLGDGDALSAQGSFKCEPYQKDGEQRIGFTLFADRVLPLNRPRKQRAQKKAAPPPASQPSDRSRLARHAGDGVDYFNDEVPF